MTLNERRVQETVRYAPGTGLVYCMNPKVACSSILVSLWLRSDTVHGVKTYDGGNPHNDPKRPFKGTARERIEAIERGVPTFSVVRNPFARLLSAYLDKIASKPRDQAVWVPIANRFGLRQDHYIPFSEFVGLITAEDQHLLEAHFRPQWMNLLHPALELSFIGRLEEPAATTAFLERHSVTLGKYTPHSQGAAQKVPEYYSQRTINLVRDYYIEDFELYGYSRDVAEIRPTRKAA